MRTATTFSGPSACAVKKAVTAESTPPDRPRTAFWKARRSNSSRRNETSQVVVNSASISRGGGPAGAAAARITGIGSLPLRLGRVRSPALGCLVARALVIRLISVAPAVSVACGSSVDGASARSPSPCRPAGVIGPPSVEPSSKLKASRSPAWIRSTFRIRCGIIV